MDVGPRTDNGAFQGTHAQANGEPNVFCTRSGLGCVNCTPVSVSNFGSFGENSNMQCNSLRVVQLLACFETD